MNNPLSTVVGLYPLPFRNPAALARSDLPMGRAPLTIHLFGDLKVPSAEAGHEHGIVVRAPHLRRRDRNRAFGRSASFGSAAAGDTGSDFDLAGTEGQSTC